MIEDRERWMEGKVKVDCGLLGPGNVRWRVDREIDVESRWMRVDFVR